MPKKIGEQAKAKKPPFAAKNQEAYLSQDETFRLVERFRQSESEIERDKIFLQLLKGHKGLFAELVNKFRGKIKRGSMEVSDLESVVRQTFFDCLGGYNQKYGKFSTYVYNAAKNNLIRLFQNDSRTIRYSVNAQRQMSLLLKAAKAFRQKHGRKMGIEEASRITGISVPRIREIMHLPKSLSLELNPVFEVKIHSTAHEPDRQVEEALLRRTVEKAINGLSPKQGEVIRLHYFEGMDLKTAGKEMSISREGARMLHKRAMRNLKPKLKRAVI